MTINVEDVKKNVVTMISDNTSLRTISPLSALGAQPITYGTDKIDEIVISGSQTAKEGDAKLLQNAGTKSVETIRGKQVFMVTASKEALNLDDQNYINRLSANVTKRIIKDVDNSIIKGKSFSDGSNASFLAGIALTENAQSIPYVEGDDFFNAFKTSLIANNSFNKGTILSQEAFNLVAYETYDATGIYKVPGATADGIFEFASHKTILDHELGYDALINGQFALPNGNLALIGDYSSISRGITDVDVRVSDEAAVLDSNGEYRSMFVHNEVAILFEVGFVAAVRNPNNFTLLSSTVADTEV